MPVVLLILLTVPTVSLYLSVLYALNPGQARQEKRSCKKTQGAMGTADTFILSWLECSHNTVIAQPLSWLMQQP